MLAGSGGALLVGGRDMIVGNAQAHLTRQVFDRIDKAHSRMLHEKANGVPAFSTAKAVEKLLRWTHAERGRLFAMKRAQPHEVGSRLAQWHIAANHLDHVDAREKFLDKSLRDAHGIIVPRKLFVTKSKKGDAWRQLVVEAL